MTLADYKIKTGSVIQLMRLLYAISSGSTLDNIVFDLYWGYPIHGTFGLKNNDTYLIKTRTGFLGCNLYGICRATVPVCHRLL
jgi:hypothetical protein